VDVVFSPQEYNNSHLARIRTLIDQAQQSIDIAIYSFGDSAISEALAAAVQRGIRVRLVFETARADQTDPANTKSSRLEDLGVDVRYVNKIMHHKFIIIDGPRESLDAANTAMLVTGSANWSGSAATRYDENTVFIQGHPEALLRYQRQFNLLWNYSRDLAWNPALEWFASMAIGDGDMVDEPDFDAIFTSDNFVVKQSSHGPTFSVVSGRNTVADRLVALIMSAKTSIHIASGHLRSRPVSEALMAKAAQDPQVEIRVYLDSQEYISSWYHSKQQRKLKDCLEAAGDSVCKHQKCLDKGFLFGYALKLAGIDVRYKYYAYRWHYSYAPQMHNKFVIIDHSTLASGSYNLSDNAEHATMENVAIYDAATFGPLVAAFETQFESLWRTGEGDRYNALLDEVKTSKEGFPIVFPAMSLDWDEVTALKGAIKANCPVINSDDYRKKPQKHLYCEF